MLTIISLPSETIYDIALQLEDKHNLGLRLVCQKICHSIDPLVLHKLYIDVGIHAFEGTRQQLSHIATQPTKLARYVRTLKIVNSGRLISFADRLGLEDLEPFKSLFPVAMRSLNNVRRILWSTNAADSEDVMSVIFHYIATCPIRHVSFNCYGGCAAGFSAQLSNIGSLQTLSLRNMSSEVAASVSRIVSRSPKLTHLEFDSGFYLANSSAPSLHGILLAREATTPLPLKSLSLRCMRILLDTTTLPHIRSLESLSIHFNLTTPTLGSYLPQIWDTLRQESIHLSKIDVNLTEVDDALLDYLISYEGIRSIKFDNSAKLWSDPRTIDTAASRFFHDVLPKVSRSLRVLHLEASSPSAWCFGRRNSASIALCTQLEDLTVSIVDLIQTHSEPTMSQFLLDQIVSGLHHLRNLTKINVASVPQIG